MIILRTSNETSLISKQKILHVQRAFPFSTCTTSKFATLFGGGKHSDEFISFSESKLGRGPQDSVRKVTSDLLLTRVEKCEKVFKKSALIHFDSSGRFRCSGR